MASPSTQRLSTVAVLHRHSTFMTLLCWDQSGHKFPILHYQYAGLTTTTQKRKADDNVIVLCLAVISVLRFTHHYQVAMPVVPVVHICTAVAISTNCINNLQMVDARSPCPKLLSPTTSCRLFSFANTITPYNKFPLEMFGYVQ